MNSNKKFIIHLTEKGRKKAEIDAYIDLMDSLQATLNNKPPTSKAIGMFVRKRWSGYVKKDRETYQFLEDYAGFCETEWPLFSKAYREHICETFEGEARKAMKKYKAAIVYIPKNTKIDSFYLDRLTNDEFIEAFKSLQKLIYAIYDAIELGSPFDWGWPDWKSLEVEGIDQNRVMKVFKALVNSSVVDGDVIIVNKKIFYGHSICKTKEKVNLTLNGFITTGLRIDELDNKKSDNFYVSCPGNPDLVTVLKSYFIERLKPCVKDCKYNCKEKWNCLNRIFNRYTTFSYRYVESSTVQTRETYFLALTDGMPEQLREMCYWLYDEAIKHGYSPTGFENMGCYSYKKGSKEWLLLGGGSSYHEDEFLHSVNYALAAKARFHRVFQTHPERIENLRKKFPDSFGRPWTACYKCKTDPDNCKNRVTFKKGNQDYHHCGAKHYFYFHDPDFDDVKAICELYKLENNIKSMK